MRYLWESGVTWSYCGKADKNKSSRSDIFICYIDVLDWQSLCSISSDVVKDLRFEDKDEDLKLEDKDLWSKDKVKDLKSQDKGL